MELRYVCYMHYLSSLSFSEESNQFPRQLDSRREVAQKQSYKKPS